MHSTMLVVSAREIAQEALVLSSATQTGSSVLTSLTPRTDRWHRLPRDTAPAPTSTKATVQARCPETIIQPLPCKAWAVHPWALVSREAIGSY